MFFSRLFGAGQSYQLVDMCKCMNLRNINRRGNPWWPSSDESISFLHPIITNDDFELNEDWRCSKFSGIFPSIFGLFRNIENISNILCSLFHCSKANHRHKVNLPVWYFLFYVFWLFLFFVDRCEALICTMYQVVCIQKWLVCIHNTR